MRSLLVTIHHVPDPSMHYWDILVHFWDMGRNRGGGAEGCRMKVERRRASTSRQWIKTPHRAYDALQEEKLAPATLVVEMKTIATLFNAARRIGLIATNPATAVELPERIRQVKRKTFTPEQVQMLLDGVSAAAATATKRGDGEAATSFLEWRTAILLGYYAGLRLSDAVTLTWENVDLAGGRISLETRKTGNRLGMPATLREAVNKLPGVTA